MRGCQHVGPGGVFAPCPGGRGNRYMAHVITLDAAGAALARVPVELGHY